MKRVSLTAVLVLVVGVCGQREARAQAFVSDVPNYGISISNTMSQIAQLLTQLGVAEEDLEIFKETFGTIQEVCNVLNDVGTLKSMYNSLMGQLEAMKMYGQMLVDMQNAGYALSTTSALISQLQSSYTMVLNMIKQGEKILLETGLTKKERVDKAEQYAKEVGSVSEDHRRMIEQEIASLQHMRGLNQFNNLLAGREADYNLSVTTEMLNRPEVDTRTYAPGEGFAPEDSAEVKGAGSRSITIMQFLFGALLAMSLIVVTMRYMRGEYQSEYGFTRIFIVLIAGLVLLSVLRNVLHLALI